jgi:5-oxopent-3-ene-1,2,5-tricarboxylate decarboxylase / 2-hydroxyhepta-2,4-diene-1,7-dioate isomerase
LRLAKFVAGGRVVWGKEEDGELIAPGGARYDPNKVSWLPPASPSKIVALVLNYADHADELGLSTSEDPILFLKPPSSLIGNNAEIVYPAGSKYMHYEGELAVVIGTSARRVSAESAQSFIKGYTIANDVTVRDFITNTFRPPLKAKGFDTFCPLGPCLVTPDEVPDPGNLEIITRVNGEVRQEGSTKSLIHSVPKLLEFISTFMTLEPDDLVLTGTPKGISPIVPGDKVDISIGRLGNLSSTVVAETEV